MSDIMRETRLGSAVVYSFVIARAVSSFKTSLYSVRARWKPKPWSGLHSQGLLNQSWIKRITHVGIDVHSPSSETRANNNISGRGALGSREQVCGLE